MPRGRPKKVVEVQGTEPAKTIQKESPKEQVSVETKTQVEEVKTSKKVPTKPVYQVGNTWLINYNGTDRYMSEQQFKIAAQQGNAILVIPKGSPFEIPENAKCSNCG